MRTWSPYFVPFCIRKQPTQLRISLSYLKWNMAWKKRLREILVDDDITVWPPVLQFYYNCIIHINIVLDLSKVMMIIGVEFFMLDFFYSLFCIFAQSEVLPTRPPIVDQILNFQLVFFWLSLLSRDQKLEHNTKCTRRAKFERLLTWILGFEREHRSDPLSMLSLTMSARQSVLFLLSRLFHV